MQQFILLVFIIICKVASSKHDIEIDHGDSHKTQIYVSDYDGSMSVSTYQKHAGGLYTIDNDETGVGISHLEPIKTTKEDSTLGQNRITSADGKQVYFSFSTAKKETRTEVFEITDSNKIKVHGTFSYVDPNGYDYLQGYEADENGYRTKVFFGTKIIYYYGALYNQVAQAKPPGGKKIDGTLLCSLGGGGCYK